MNLARRTPTMPEPMLSTSSYADDLEAERSRPAVPMHGLGPDEPGPGWFRRLGRRLFTLIMFLVAIGLGAAVVWAVVASFDDTERLAQGETVTIEVPDGATANEVARLLSDAGVVGNRFLFAARLRAADLAPEIQAGDHVFGGGWSFARISEELTKAPPPAPVYDLVIPEGFRNSDTAAKIDDLRAEAGGGPGQLPAFSGREYLAAISRTPVPRQWKQWVPADVRTSRDAVRLEGFLYPATYELLEEATPADLIERQLAAFVENVGSVDMTRARKAQLSPYEVLIIASMVEREARVPEERPLIAAVIWNRIREGMTLGIDATVQYAVDPDTWKQDLTLSDLDIDSPYNTRKLAGLPPTPIANPGIASIEAAANPADVDHLYYVLEDEETGAHFFTDDYDEFLSAQP